MAYTVSYSDDDDYVSVVLADDVSRSEHERSTDEASAALVSRGCKRLLVDTRKSDHRMTVGEEFEFARALSSRHPPGVRIAVLILPEDALQLKFVENVAQNRGVDLWLFTEEDRAYEWLLGG